jgi:tRNA 5-methylaminomethyl-2-thiouridine biosynthesis bifunctional protein
MKTRPIAPCAAGCQQADHPADPDLIAGNGLPQRWQGSERFVVLETGFGLGNNFLATWQAWRQDPSHCQRLVFIAIEPNPFSADTMRRAHSPLTSLAAELIAAWPPLTHNLHSLQFEGGRVELLLALGDVSSWLPELVAQVDALYLDGSCQPQHLKALALLSAPQATLATRTATSALRNNLRTAGFDVQGDQPGITLARYAPAFAPRISPSRLAAPAGHRRALVIGAGLAGCATAAALAAQGWSSTVYDRQPLPAQETSGNPGGLFHGIVNAQDGTHARFNRAAALHAQQAVSRALRSGAVKGSAQGLLRLDHGDATDMSALLARLGLPANYVRAVSPTEASALSGLGIAQAAWFYPGGGWVQPAALARRWLQDAAPLASFRGDTHISRLQQAGAVWQLLDAQDRVIDEAEVVVLANAGDALRLLGQPAWPIEPVRGQISIVDSARMLKPTLPLAGGGYLLSDGSGLTLFGATSQAGDMDGSVRGSDHTANLAQLGQMLGGPIELPLSALSGRTGWRWSAQDRLPVIGAVPDPQGRTLDRPLDQPRFVPRMGGLYVFTALGSRGITWSPLGAQTLAALITGAPCPLEASLLDAVDPARFVSRAVRRQARPANP